MLVKIKLLLFLIDKETKSVFLKLFLAVISGFVSIVGATLVLTGNTKTGLVLISLSIMFCSLSIAISAVKSIKAFAPILLSKKRR